MPSKEVGISDEIMTGEVRVPEHVVHREFPAETVILNLDTGQYHGLNPTAGRMLEVLQDSESVGDAVEQLAGEFGQSREALETDVRQLCTDLLSRGLIEIHPIPES